MVWNWAADAPIGTGSSEALITAVGAFLGIVVMTVGTIVVQALKARTERTDPSLPSPMGGTALLSLAKDIGTLVERADDTDESVELIDRTLARLVRWAEDHDPDGWGRS